MTYSDNAYFESSALVDVNDDDEYALTDWRPELAQSAVLVRNWNLLVAPTSASETWTRPSKSVSDNFLHLLSERDAWMTLWSASLAKLIWIVADALVRRLWYANAPLTSYLGGATYVRSLRHLRRAETHRYRGYECECCIQDEGFRVRYVSQATRNVARIFFMQST